MLEGTDFFDIIVKKIFRGIAWIVKKLLWIVVWLAYDILWEAIAWLFNNSFGWLWKKLKGNKK